MAGVVGRYRERGSYKGSGRGRRPMVRIKGEVEGGGGGVAPGGRV